MITAGGNKKSSIAYNIMSIFRLTCLIWFVCGLQVLAAVLQKGDKHWWKNTQIYEVYIRSFKDSDGDGIGDLRGVISVLDHFVELKIETLWLTPFFKSPMEDRGYDIEVFTEVDPLFGTMDDFEELMREAKKRKLRVLMDFVANHSSSTHEWFQKSVNRIKPYDKFYVWADAKGRDENGNFIPPCNWVSRFDGSAWEWNEKRQQFYFHQFLPSMPDFDLRNRTLKAELKKVLEFWLDKGLDGVRLDAANYLLEDPQFRDEPLIRYIPVGEELKYFDLKHIYTKNLQENLDFVRELRKFLDDKYNKVEDLDEKILVIEAYAPIKYTINFYGDHQGNKRAHYPFNFSFTQMEVVPSAGVLDHYIKSWMNEMPRWATVNWNAENHDLSRITGRLPDEYHAILTTMQMTLPGVACVYYGQEIGMTDISPAAEKDLNLFIIRDRSKAPMQWDDSLNAGFTTSTNPWLPMQADYRKVNVKLQKKDPGSPYNRFKMLSHLRQTPTMKSGKFKTFVLTRWVYAFTRTLEGHPTYLVIANLGSKTEAVDPYVEGIEKHEVFTVVTSSENSILDRGFEIPPQSVLLKILMKPKSIVVLTTIEPAQQRRNR